MVPLSLGSEPALPLSHHAIFVFWLLPAAPFVAGGPSQGHAHYSSHHWTISLTFAWPFWALTSSWVDFPPAHTRAGIVFPVLHHQWQALYSLQSETGTVPCWFGRSIWVAVFHLTVTFDQVLDYLPKKLCGWYYLFTQIYCLFSCLKFTYISLSIYMNSSVYSRDANNSCYVFCYVWSQVTEL